LKNKINNLPQKPGIYFFRNAAERVIYVGKAKDLKKRVKNHFAKPGQHMFDFIAQVSDIDFIQTVNENEALLLEQQFIKQLQPRWNVEWKDDKNYFYVAITDEDFPCVYLSHQPKVEQGETLLHFGPFVSGREVKAFLREIRKILPYRTCRNMPKKSCFYQSLNLCAAPCVNKRMKTKYQQMIDTLKVLLEIYQGAILRIEGYDISNLSGTLAVGSMVVFESGKRKPSDYRKFRIKRVKGQNDVKSLREVILRRQKHPEWPISGLTLLDGGKGQLKAAKGLKTPILALAKTGQGRLFSPFSKSHADLVKLPKNVRDLLLQVRDESHRFVITYHKSRRAKSAVM